MAFSGDADAGLDGFDPIAVLMAETDLTWFEIQTMPARTLDHYRILLDAKRKAQKANRQADERRRRHGNN